MIMGLKKKQGLMSNAMDEKRNGQRDVALPLQYLEDYVQYHHLCHIVSDLHIYIYICLHDDDDVCALAYPWIYIYIYIVVVVPGMP
jgi:hypothetical protein